MRFLKRAAIAAVLAVGFTGASSSSAQAYAGCVGFPDFGGLWYHCMEANAALPRVSTAGTTYAGTTVPAFCYFLGCTSQMPVGYTVPVSITTSRPTDDITVFELEFACTFYWYGRYCNETYEIIYDAPTNSCEFRTTQSTLSDVNGRRFPCMV